MINLYSQKWVLRLVPGTHEQEAICVWPFIFYSCEKAVVSDRLRRHEEYHWHHQLRWLVIPWFVIYGLMWLQYGYSAHPWEKLARAAVSDTTK